MVQSVRNLLDRGFRLEGVGSDDDWLILEMETGDLQRTVQLDREAARQLLASPLLDRLLESAEADAPATRPTPP